MIADCENNPELNEDEMLKSTQGVEPINCNYYDCDNAFEALIQMFGTYDYILYQFIGVSIICLLIIAITIIYICSTKCKFNVTENNICGKKGSKKFVISYSDIKEIAIKGKGIIIRTENQQFKISPLKNCNEIYNQVKLLVPKSTTEQQTTSTVDDINLF